MKQEVFVIGPDLRELVPFSLTFVGSDYSVTLVEAQDVVRRATELSAHHEAWFLLLLSGDEDASAAERLERLAPTTSMIIEDGADPLIALAHLIALTTWDSTQPEESPARTTIKAKEQYG